MRNLCCSDTKGKLEGSSPHLVMLPLVGKHLTTVTMDLILGACNPEMCPVLGTSHPAAECAITIRQTPPDPILLTTTFIVRDGVLLQYPDIDDADEEWELLRQFSGDV